MFTCLLRFAWFGRRQLFVLLACLLACLLAFLVVLLAWFAPEVESTSPHAKEVMVVLVSLKVMPWISMASRDASTWRPVEVAFFSPILAWGAAWLGSAWRGAMRCGML